MTFNLDGWQALSLLVSSVLPLLVGLVTNKVTSAGTKATLLAALTAVAGFGSEVLAAHQAHQAYSLADGAVSTVLSFAIAVALHHGLYKPVGLAGVLAEIGVQAKMIPAAAVAPLLPNAPLTPLTVSEVLAGKHAAPDTAVFPVPSPAVIAADAALEAAKKDPAAVEQEIAAMQAAVDSHSVTDDVSTVIAPTQVSDVLAQSEVQSATTVEPPATS